ncbi:hypothetical protein [Halapricum salinum]|uniref:Uncharacterized protein n=1 Tax=Halapricum salinum TaxID=1457250 RepID=A0A4D6HA54_9EURY|nr:hypothetical protein [Halapricum salinum]QCC50028.1 hypothetical protein DV733_01790 [Halapricum salinum]
MRRLRATVREFTRASALLVIGWYLLAVSVLLGAPAAELSASLPFAVGGAALGTYLGGTIRPSRLRLWAQLLGGVGSVGVGVWVAWTYPLSALWVGVGTVLVGGWLALDAVAVFRLDPFFDGAVAVEYGDLHETIGAADAPRSLQEIGDRLGATDTYVRSVVAVLQSRGDLERQAKGYVANNLYLGPGFSIHGLCRRLIRPLRVLT